MVFSMFRSLGDAVGRDPAVAIALDDADLVVDLTELQFIDAATDERLSLAASTQPVAGDVF